MSKRHLLPLLIVIMLASPVSVMAGETVSLAFVGDIMLADDIGQLVKNGNDPFAPFAKTLNESDFRIGNLECVIATRGKAEAGKPWVFRAHPRTLQLLKKHFDALGIANNHTGDYGPQALTEMLGLLKQKNMSFFGGGNNLAEAHAPLIIERKGLKIALLGYNEFFPRSFEADYDKPGIAWSEDEQVQYDIAKARTQYHADLVITFMHWGLEHEQHSSPRQQSLAHWMIDAGADAVVGGHPHVTQEIEHYKGKPIIYSLGNFVFDGFSDEDNNTGWLLQLQMDRQGVQSGRVVVAHIDAKGSPHPAGQDKNVCWHRGRQTSAACQ